MLTHNCLLQMPRLGTARLGIRRESDEFSLHDRDDLHFFRGAVGRLRRSRCKL